MKKKEQDKAGDFSSSSSSSNEVIIDQDKLKKGMAALFLSGNINTDDLADALAAAIAGIE